MDLVDKLDRLLGYLGVSADLRRRILLPIFVVLVVAGAYLGLIKLGFALRSVFIVLGLLVAWLVAASVAWRFSSEAAGWVVAAIAAVLLLPSLIVIWVVAGQTELRVPFLLESVFLLGAAVVLRWRGQWARYVTLVTSFIGLGAVAIATANLITRAPVTSAGRVGVFVASFAKDTNGRIQARLLERLRFAARRDPTLRLAVEVYALPVSLAGSSENTQFDKARAACRQRNGDIIIFGTATSAESFTKIALCWQPFGLTAKELVVANEDLTALVPGAATVRSVDELVIQLLIWVYTGAVQRLRGECVDAEQQFHKAATLLPSIDQTRIAGMVVEMDYLQLYEGSAILCQSEGGGDEKALQRAAAIYDSLASGGSGPILAFALLGQGVTYRRLADYRDAPANLERSIVAFRQAQALVSAMNEPGVIARVRTNLGVAYEKLAQYRDGSKNLRIAIGLHEEALQGIDGTDDVVTLAGIETNLGVAYEGLAIEEQSEAALQQALVYHHKAGARLTVSDAKQRWLYVNVRINEGSALRNLGIWRDNSDDLMRAQHALEDGLKWASRSEMPFYFAMLNYHLGRTGLVLGQKLGRRELTAASVMRVACALAVFDEHGHGGAHIAARTLDKSGFSASDALVGAMQDAPQPDGCAVDAHVTAALLQKWR